MNKYSKTIEIFVNDMQKYSVSNKIAKFAYQTKANFIVSAIVASKPNGISFESLCRIVKDGIASRSTIQKILEDGVETNFFLKDILSSDKRVRHYTLSNDAKTFFRKWIQRQEQIFNTRDHKHPPKTAYTDSNI